MFYKVSSFCALRCQDGVAISARIPRGARGRDSQGLLTLSYALLGRVDEAAAARAELLAAYPSMSAELLLNQDWAFARTEEERLLLDGFRAAGLDLCASEADLAGVTNARHLPDCATSMPGGGATRAGCSRHIGDHR